jgi:hypothetical protein
MNYQDFSLRLCGVILVVTGRWITLMSGSLSPFPGRSHNKNNITEALEVRAIPPAKIVLQQTVTHKAK